MFLDAPPPSSPWIYLQQRQRRQKSTWCSSLLPWAHRKRRWYQQCWYSEPDSGAWEWSLNQSWCSEHRQPSNRVRDTWPSGDNWVCWRIPVVRSTYQQEKHASPFVTWCRMHKWHWRASRHQSCFEQWHLGRLGQETRRPLRWRAW